MSDAIVSRIDDMGNKIDELEKSMNDLIKQAEAGVESTTTSGNSVSKSTASKVTSK